MVVVVVFSAKWITFVRNVIRKNSSMKDFYIFSTRNRLTEVEKCGAASIRTTVAERGYTPML